jgi:putative aldouronate transport system substrate-binding protein
MWPYNDWTGAMPRWATEQTGVSLDVTVGADSNELPVMIASGAMSDLIIAPSQFFGILSNQNVCYDWGGLYEQYNLSTQIHPAYQFVNRATDGKFYTVQVGWSAPYEYKQYPKVNPETNGGAAREDILKVIYKKLGISQIKSIKDLEDALQVCKDEFPGVTPYAFQSDWSKDGYMENLYGLAGSGFVDDGTGKAMLWIKQPLRKDYYMKLNEWARKGLILEETYSWTAFNTLYETAIAGNVFFAAFHCTTGDLFDQLSKSAGTDYTWEQMDDLETPNLKILETSPGWRGLYITKSCKDPGAAIRFADFMVQKDSQYTMMWGFEGKDWKWNADRTVAEFTYDITLDSEKVEEMQLRWGWIVHDGISNNMYTVASPGKTNDGKRWGGDHTVRMPTLGLLMNKMDVESEEYVIYENLRELEKNAQDIHNLRSHAGRCSRQIRQNDGAGGADGRRQG